MYKRYLLALAIILAFPIFALAQGPQLVGDSLKMAKKSSPPSVPGATSSIIYYDSSGNPRLLKSDTSDSAIVVGTYVTTFNTRSGAVTSQAGDYTTSIVAEGSNQYFTNTRARTAIDGTARSLTGLTLVDFNGFVRAAAGVISASALVAGDIPDLSATYTTKPAGGDLTGTLPNPTVATIGGASAVNVADAVTKRHSQNTDTGTTQTTFIINSTGSQGIIDTSLLTGNRTFKLPDLASSPTLLTNLSSSGSFPTLNQNTTGSSANFTGSLVGDVIGTQGATVIDVGKVTNAMLAGAIANNKLSNSTISGVALGGNLSSLTPSARFSGSAFNGSTPVTLDLATVGSSGSCTNCNLSVDTYGRVTTYVNGSGGGGGTIGGTVSAGYLPYGASTDTLANSPIFLNSGNTGFNSIHAQYPLKVTTATTNGLKYALQIQNADINNSGGSSVGILFTTETDDATTDFGKGALVYERTGNFGTGKFHFLQKNSANNTNVALADAVFSIMPGGSVNVNSTTQTTYRFFAGGTGGFSGNLTVDTTDANTGTALNFLNFGNGSGEGVGSKRTSGTGQYGLDFYTNSTIQGRVFSGGNWNLGTSSDLGYKLGVNGTFYSVGDISKSTNGSSSGSPATIGFADWSSGEYNRIHFGDTASAIQTVYSGRIQLYSYHGIEIIGGRANLTPPTNIAGSGSSDPSLTIFPGTTGGIGLTVKGLGSQTGNLVEYKTSANTTLFSFTSGGNMGIGNITPDYASDIVGSLRLRKNSVYNPGGDGESIFFSDNFPTNVGELKSYNIDATYYGLKLRAWNGSALADIMALKGNGRVSIGNTNFAYNLDVTGTIGASTSVNIGASASGSAGLNFSTALGAKIHIYDSVGGTYGLGLQTGLFQIFSGTSTDVTAIGYGSSASFTGALYVKGTNTGAGVSDPLARFHAQKAGSGVTEVVRVENSNNSVGDGGSINFTWDSTVHYLGARIGIYPLGVNSADLYLYTANGSSPVVRQIIANDGLIVFGATKVSSVPALRPSSAVLEAVLGDGSAYTDFRVARLGVGVNPTSLIQARQIADSTNTSTPIAFSLDSVGAAGELTASSGTQVFAQISPTINQSGTGSYQALNIDVTQTATGSGAKTLINAAVGGTSKFDVSSIGDLTAAGDVTGSNIRGANHIITGGVFQTEGSNGSMGVATLVGGTVTVSNTRVTANSRIFLTPQAGSTNLGGVSVSARNAGADFTILSTNILDVRVIAYEIKEPN